MHNITVNLIGQAALNEEKLNIFLPVIMNLPENLLKISFHN